MKIKITTVGFDDNTHSIGIEEAHKAYYLFLNPNERGVFEDGLALRGQDIRSIEPDYQATIGWNPTYKLTSEDWNIINAKGIDRKLRDMMFEAKQIAQSHATMIDKPLSDAIKLLK